MIEELNQLADEYLKLSVKAEMGNITDLEAKQLKKVTTEFIMKNYEFAKSVSANQESFKEELDYIKQAWEETELLNRMYSSFIESQGLTQEFLTYMDKSVDEATANVRRSQLKVVK